MPIDLQQPEYLILFILIPVYILIYFKGSRPSGEKKEKFVLVIRLILISLLVLSLTRPVVSLLSRDQTVMFVVDRSASITTEKKTVEKNFVREAIQQKNSDDRVGVLAFGEESMIEKKLDEEPYFYEFETRLNDNFTDIEDALELGLNSLTSKKNGRIVLISDGRENVGSVTNIISEYRDKETKIDVFPLKQDIRKELLVKNMIMPGRLSGGGQFEIKTTIKSNYNTTANLSIYHNNKIIKEDEVEINPGNNFFEYPLSISSKGFQKLRIKIDDREDHYSENNVREEFIIVEGQKKVLLVGDSSGAAAFQRSLVNKNIAVDQVKVSHFNFSHEELLQYDALVLNNIPSSSFNLQQMKNIISYVKDTGGGLLVTGGDNSFGAGNYSNTPLDNVLPVSSKVKSKVFFPTTTLLVTLDKSESMKEVQSGSGNLTKLDLAKEAAVGILDIMVRDEKIGIVAFDTQAELVVPIQQAENKMDIYEKLSQVKADGGTDLYGGLSKSLDTLIQDDSAVKHIILLSDGKSIPGDFKEITDKLVEKKVTLTTVALGEQVDKELMQNLAEWGKGKYYYTDKVNSLPQIFSAEAKRIISTPVRRKSFKPEVNEGFHVVTDINPEDIPPLEGFVATTPRKLADVILNSPDQYPIFASWRYGLGKSAVFTADLGERFSRNWLNWSGYNKFWPDVINWIMRSTSNNNVFPHIVRKGNKGIIKVDAVDDEGNYLNFLDLEATVIKPDESTAVVELNQTAPGQYQGGFNIDSRGVHMITINWEQNGSPRTKVTGYVVSYSPEYDLLNHDNNLLEQLANKTGGRLLNSPQEVFSYRPFNYTGSKPVWPYIVALAVLLFLVDVALRVVNIDMIKKIIFGIKNRSFDFVDDIRDNLKNIEE